MVEVLLDNLKPRDVKSAAIPIVNMEFKIKHIIIIFISPSLGILKKSVTCLGKRKLQAVMLLNRTIWA